MSAEQVSILINCVDNATATLNKINQSVQNLGTQFTQTANDSQKLNQANEKSSLTAIQTVQAFDRLSSSLMNLWKSYDRAEDSAKYVDRANIKLARAQERLVDLQQAYDRAVKNTTIDVEKLARAELARDKASQGVAKSQDAVFEAQRNLNIAIFETGSGSYDTLKAQKELQYAMENVGFAQRELGFAESDVTKVAKAPLGAESEAAKELSETIKIQTEQVEYLKWMVEDAKENQVESWLQLIISGPMSIATIVASINSLSGVLLGKTLLGAAGGTAGGASTVAGLTGAGTSLGFAGAGATGVLATAGGIGAAPIVAMGAATLGVGIVGGYGFAKQEEQRRLGMQLMAWQASGEKTPVPAQATPEQIDMARKEYARQQATLGGRVGETPTALNIVDKYNTASSNLSSALTGKYASLPAQINAVSGALAQMAQVIVASSANKNDALLKMAGVESQYKMDAGQKKMFESYVNSQMVTQKIPAMALGGVVTKPTVLLAGEAGKEAVVPLSKYVISERNSGAGLTQNITVPITINATINGNQDIKELARKISVEISENLRRRK